MKKIISVLLCLTLIFALGVPAFAAEQAEEYPTIYVTGAQTNNIYGADGEVIYPVEADFMAIVKESIVPCLEKLVMGFIAGDYSDYAQELYDAIGSVYAKVKLDKAGEASDGSHPQYHSSTVSVSEKQSGYGMWDYRFWYDWRLSPITTAEELMNYIDRVKAATKKDKVQLVGRCYGANVIQTYITLYKDHAIENVSDIAYYASSVSGIDFMSAAFSGNVVLEEQAVANFIEYYIDYENIIEDDTLSVFACTLVELFNRVKVLGVGTDVLQAIFDEIKTDVVPLIVRETMGSWPSYWSMVTAELYKQSIDFIFGDCKDEYAEFIKKTDNYYYNVQLKAEETILELKEKGINFYTFTKYGFADFPFYEGATNEGDSYTSVVRQSFGAESADYGKVLSAEYISSLTDKTYLSPDNKIDASTALLPDTSWFIKNLHHNYFEVLHNMTLEIMRYDLTVHNDKYPQYIYHDNNTLTPIVGLDEDGTKVEGEHSVFIRFLTAFINLLTKIFKGEFSFSLEGILG